MTRLLAAMLCIVLAGCWDGEEAEIPTDRRVPGADVERGRTLVGEVGCGACHAIRGLPGARGRVGPSLNGFGGRNFIAGRFANRPQNLSRWVRNAPSMAPETAMPAMPLTRNEARDVAAYLYTLR